MTRKEVTGMLSLLRISYPSFYGKMKNEDLEYIVDLWHEMFREDDADAVKYALKELIATHSGYPPDIAAVKSKIRSLKRAVSGDGCPEQLWQRLKRAAENSGWSAREEFEKLPPVLKSYVGGAGTLREYGQMNAETFNTVVRARFMKEIEAIEDRELYRRSLPENVKALLSGGSASGEF